ncbi:hydroxyacid dehydrogenase (plasmid) [Streptomyces sp. NBC_00841]|uniref:hydroxyacid dehydrogenase n=1 Tax=unclassified Streptomyces TaxID=2593676 RepID=UPI00224EBC50|nr:MULTISPECIES: hydroxyacid dehydrogenase [unclassified Streptomyces]MCX4538845.1 hydroxyacid dehydrogenase [Streptomyces sp. NBC_01669]WSA05361.1 hydroxyacid dehydrogenase [Streptomyces sp. NBC_00841]
MRPTPTNRPRALFAMGRRHRDALFPPAEIQCLTAYVDIDPDHVAEDFAHEPALEDVEVLITSWGCPVIDEDVLARAPALKAIVHAAGSVKHHVTQACWDRGLMVSSAAAANAVPVAEYTVAAILFANKRVLDIGGLYREHRSPLDWSRHFPGFGNYRRTVGLVGASLVGRKVLELLRPYDLDLLLADPYIDAAQAAALGARHVGLDELVGGSDVVSLHAPALPETRHLLDARRLSLMRDGATLVNTARGSLVDTEALTAEAATGRIHAVIDVTEPEVLPATSPLYFLPNVLLTPHIAGSLGGELHRITSSALDEVERYCSRRPFAHAVHHAALATSA